MQVHVRFRKGLIPFFLLFFSTMILASPGYISMPDLHGSQVVFTAEGDLWSAGLQGGAARRLTTHPGTEQYARFSPDGKTIAFSGEYGGNQDIFVIPAGGGEPRRLTWHPAEEEVLGWTPDGSRILFRSSRGEPHGNPEIYALSPQGGEAERVPLGWAGRLAIDPQTGRYAFNRISVERATWKRYRGGMAPAIWVGDPKPGDYRQVTTFPGLNAFPMWHGGRIFFLSDQGGTVNIWSMQPDGSGRQQHTRFSDWDARWPAMAPDGRIVFMLGGDMQLFDPQDDSVRVVKIDLPSDRILTRVRYTDPGRFLTNFDISPDGERLAVVSRGEIFSVPVKNGVTLPVTQGSGARENWVSFDPEGKRLAYVTDEPLEEEIRTTDSWGRGRPVTVKPAGTGGWHYPPLYSGDGKWIAYADQTQTLSIVPAAGGEPKALDRGDQSPITDYAWSPDGRFLAYSKSARTDYASIYIHDTKDGQTHRVTGPATDDRNPVWDPDGRYLFFAGNRLTNPVLDTRDLAAVELKPGKLYAVLLKQDTPNPLIEDQGLPPREEAGKDKAKKDEAKPEKSKEEAKEEKPAPKPVEIDFEGLERRVIELPVPGGLYGALAATSKKLFFLSFPVQGMAEGPQLFEEAPPQNTLMAFDWEKKEPKPFLEGVDSFALSVKSGKLAVLKNKGEIFVVDGAAPAAGDLSESRVDLGGIVLDLDPREEWKQIYYETWRQMRDFYWDPGMAQVDWKAVRDRYAALLPLLASRADLTDLLGEVIGEMSTSHTYIFGGDPGVRVVQIPTGLLGADLAREGDFFRVVRILRGDPADRVRSPLEEPGVGVAEGDYLIALDHRPFPGGMPFEALLENRAGKNLALTVNTKPAREGAREVVVTPLPSDAQLRYADWVRRNREYVAAKTGGKIGYLHIPDMMTGGLVAFDTWFYPQLDKEGMVVDARWNGGGFVSQILVERLRRRVLGFDRARNGTVISYPYRTLNGPFVVLTNEFAGSDGDIFPAAIQLEKLAPVIGMRSWGGVNGINSLRPLVDGGLITQPEAALWDPKQGYGLENRGVIPDIEVQNLPQDLAAGKDPQLDRALDELKIQAAARPRLEPAFPPAPPKNREAHQKE